MSYVLDLRTILRSAQSRNGNMEEAFQTNATMKNSIEYTNSAGIVGSLSYTASMETVSFYSMELALDLALTAADKLIAELEELKSMLMAKSHEENDRNNP